MKTAIKAYSFGSVVAAFGALFGGCATGPRYDYTEQNDSARIEAPVKPEQRIEQYGSCYIQIMQIDGFVANFVASRPGGNWLPGGTEPLYVSPGKHTLTLDVAEVATDIGETSRGHTGTVGEFDVGSQPTLTAVLVANHVYRVTADLPSRESMIKVTLWDETSGTAARTPVATWAINSNGSYSEYIPSVHDR